MDEVIEHVSDDLVARVKAGTTLGHLSRVLAKERQRFPVDEVVPGSTIGGRRVYGPFRAGLATCTAPFRDLVLGATVVRADGVVARVGSKVVKNVAGYDLAKLLTGSYGTLGILSELTLKLRPLPAAQCFLVAPYPGPADLGAALSALLSSQSSSDGDRGRAAEPRRSRATSRAHRGPARPG